ncbi:MAG: hypothetical protein IJ443_09925 [Firmicutes bacterium]|nr:hypothetical protein [Bacillota bacterium]
MAVNERTNSSSYEYQPLYTGAAAFQPAYPQKETEEPKRVRRTRARPKAETQGQTQYVNQGLTLQELHQLIGIAVLVGVLLIGLLVVNAYAASVQCSINDLTKANIALEDEIDTLNMKIYSSTSIEQIESYAMDELKMRYPTSSQCIYIEEDAVLMDNFASVIRQRAYE